MRVVGQTPFGQQLQLDLEPFGAAPGAFFILRVSSCPEAYLAYMRNVMQAPERNLPACRKALEFIAEQGYRRVLISYFAASPLDAIFEKLSPTKVSMFQNVHGRLDRLAFKSEGEALRLAEVDYDDPRLRKVYDDWIALGCDRLAASAPDLFFSIWRFDACASGRKPLLALDARDAAVGALFFWDEPSHYDPKTVLAFFCYPKSTLDSGSLDALFAAGYARIAGLGFSHALACADLMNEPLRRMHAKYGFTEIAGMAGQFLCREFAAAGRSAA